MTTFRSLRSSLGVYVVLTYVLSGPVLAEDSLKNRVDQLVQPYLDSDIVMSMSIGVINKGTSEAYGYGQLSKNDRRTPNGDTVYEIGSITKAFTGVLLADAITQGHVQLDQPAGELLPETVTMPSHADRAITLRDLATHVSGLPRLPKPFTPSDWNNPYADFDGEKLGSFLSRHQLSRVPGQKSEYSNLGMGLLGYLLANQAESTYPKLLRARIAEPLGMQDTTIKFHESQLARLAPPHDASNAPATNWDLTALAGAGGIRSTVNDMLRFANANITPPKGQLGEAIELAWQVHQKPLTKKNFAMGLGWHIARDGKTRWHNGQTGGYHSMMLINRELNAAVVLLANTATGEVDALAQDIIRMLAGAKVEPRRFEESTVVPADVMERYVGKYKLVEGVEFTVTLQESKLFVQLTGQPALQVFARSDTEWFYKVVEASITFKVDDAGKCQSLELFQNGIRQTANRVQ